MIDNEPMIARIASSGLDENNVLWPAEILRDAAPLFEGRPVHPAHADQRVGKSAWGHLSKVRFVSQGSPHGYLTGYLMGLVRPIDGRIAMRLREAAVAGHGIGLSLHISGNVYQPKNSADGVVVPTNIRAVRSVDLVERPAMENCRIIAEMSGVPLLLNDPRLALLLDGRPPEPATPAMEGARGQQRSAVVTIREALDDFSDQTADAFVAGFAELYGPGPWKIRSAVG